MRVYVGLYDEYYIGYNIGNDKYQVQFADYNEDVEFYPMNTGDTWYSYGGIDLAIITLRKEITLSTLQANPICIFRGDLQPDLNYMKVTGWGKRMENKTGICIFVKNLWEITKRSDF